MFNPVSFHSGALVLGLLACTQVTFADVLLELPAPERDSAWFAPTLTKRASALCDDVLRIERDRFFAPAAPASQIAGLMPIGEEGAPAAPRLDGYFREHALTLPGGTQAFLYFIRHPGCGGACEGESVAIGTARIVEDRLRGASDEYRQSHIVPATRQWQLYEASNGEFYLRGELDDRLQVYRAAAPAQWELTCEVSLIPDDAAYSDEIRRALGELGIAAAAMAGNAGDCGSLRTHSRWQAERPLRLRRALFQPWGMVESQSRSPSDNSYGDYQRVERNLQLWSLGGLTQYREFASYQKQFTQTADQVARFYVARFGWNDARAQQMADAALKGAISRTFGFYSYDPYPAPGEVQLRQAILSGASLEQIQALKFDVAAIDRANEDSILNLAVASPEVLRHLLDRKFDPNIANAFGKTPLMYAAQYDQFASAEMLLKAGADPNAATYQPDDHCAYMVWTRNVTPLHYAARNASPELIALLIDNGALTFSQSEGNHSGEYPIDWLATRAGTDVTDKQNPQFPEGEFAAVSKALAVPSEEQKIAMASDFVARARAEYTKGNAVRAYQHLRAALIAQPGNPSAISDLPLVALRAGYFAPALVAAAQATQTLKDPGALAGAWFNKGLVCEQPKVRELGYFNGAVCESVVLEPFVKAWKMQPTSARANKLKALFKQSEWVCAPAGGSQTRSYRVSIRDDGNALRIHALHPRGVALDPSKVSWTTKAGALKAIVVDELQLGEDTLTVLEVPRSNDQFSIDGQACKVSR